MGFTTTKEKHKSKQDLKKQLQEKKAYLEEIRRQFSLITKDGSKAAQIYQAVVKHFPGKATGDTLTKRKNLWVKSAKQVPEIMEFAEKLGGPERMNGPALYIIRDAVFGIRPFREAKDAAEHMADLWFRENRKQEGGKHYEEAGYSEEMRKFLPENLSFKLGPSREILEITEIFGRQQKSWLTMMKKLAYIAKNFNKMVSEVKKDMKSGNEANRLCALLMAITIETGMRPGGEGNKAKVVDPETGEKIEVETFGITTLKPEHIKFVKDGFAELRFIGKKGAENISEVRDKSIIEGLRALLDSARGKGNSKTIFVTKDGEVVDDNALRKYASDKWGDISPTDFRKLKGTQVFYDGIKEQIEQMNKDIRELVSAKKEKLKEILAQKIADILNRAAEKAQKALSHEDVAITVSSYIDPRVLINFLSRGNLDDELKDILTDNKGVVLRFNTDAFLSKIKTAKNIMSYQVFGTGESAKQLLESLDELKEILSSEKTRIGVKFKNERERAEYVKKHKVRPGTKLEVIPRPFSPKNINKE